STSGDIAANCSVKELLCKRWMRLRGNQACANYLRSAMKMQRSSTMKHYIPHLAVTITLLSLAFGQSASQQNSQDGKSEQGVSEMIEKYRSALLQRDIPALEKIWADDYDFVNDSRHVLTKSEQLE